MKIVEASKEDLKSILELLLNDPLGNQRENLSEGVWERYAHAFEYISNEKDNSIYVAKDGKNVVGTFQLTFIQNLTYSGGLRGQIEGVRVHKSKRGKGLGKLMMQKAFALCQERGAHLLQLTTDKRRPDAIEFYEGLGFKSSHEGMKLHLA